MKVLVKPNGRRGSDVYHRPNEDGKPICGQEGPTDKEWVEKDSSAYPNARLCKKCEGEHSGGVSGPILANKLSDIDASEV